VARWQEYQEEAAVLFRSLGLGATTDESLDGGAHKVDVVVRSRRAGLEQLWVVECMWRRRRVEKQHVKALGARSCATSAPTGRYCSVRLASRLAIRVA
jgi:hypothetical protein